MSNSDSIKQYLAHRKSEAPELVEAFDLQVKIEQLERNLAEYREALAEQLKIIAEREIHGTFFNVTDMRPRREVDVNYVREHLPEVFDRCATLSNAAIVDILETTSGGRANLIKTLKKLDTNRFNESVKINVGDVERALGKRGAEKLEGTAIRTVYRPSNQTKILYIGDKIQVGGDEREALE